MTLRSPKNFTRSNGPPVAIHLNNLINRFTVRIEMKSVTFIVLSFIFFSSIVWAACPLGMTADENLAVLTQIQEATKASTALRIVRDIPKGSYSCSTYQVTNNCYVNRPDTVSTWHKDPQVVVAFGNMLGAFQFLPEQDHDGINHIYYSLNDRIIVEASLTFDEFSRVGTVLSYLDCKLISK
jgi:hypothetical protein